MFNIGLDRSNRAARRRAMKYNNEGTKVKNSWQEQKHLYKPRNTPTDLGINAYKRLHSDEPERVVYYKQEMWKAFHELK